jgi:hypothetical protein
MKLTKVMGCLFLATISFAQASEIDSFRNRNVAIKDSKNIINAKANEFFIQAIDAANGKGICNKKRLYKKIHKYFGNHYSDKMTKWILKTDKIDVIGTSFKNSIYQDFIWYQAPVQSLFAKIVDSSGIVLNYNGYRVGSDKFEHLFGRGYAYYKMTYVKNKPLEDALIFGKRLEKNRLGSSTTGVMSYGDLVANLQGIRFWNDILGDQEDIFSEDITPFLACENEKWVISKISKIDFSRYVDAGWDEAINCSAIKNQRMLDRMETRISALAQSQKMNLTCPVDSIAAANLREKYADYAEYVLNLDGFTIVKTTNRRLKRKNLKLKEQLANEIKEK